MASSSFDHLPVSKYKENSLHNLSEGKFSKGGDICEFTEMNETMTLLADKIFVLLYIKLIKY